ncbi:MAG: hypothetical protein Tsb0021_03840 [Chlamydiales bacterium]
MFMSKLAFYAYGFIVIIGGIIGFATAQSYPSLVMGGLVGLMIVVSTALLDKYRIQASRVLFAAIFVLTVFFLYRFILTMKFMPAGLMILLSLAALSLYMRQFYRD